MKSGVVIYGFTPAVPAPTSLSGPDVAAPPSDTYRRSGELRKPPSASDKPSASDAKSLMKTLSFLSAAGNGEREIEQQRGGSLGPKRSDRSDV